MYKKRSAVLLIDPSLICQILTTFQMITLQKKKKKKDNEFFPCQIWMYFFSLNNSGPVHSNPDIFETAPFFIYTSLIGLPSTRNQWIRVW